EDEAAADVGGAGEQDGRVHQPDAAGRGAIDGHGDDVIHVGGRGVSDGREDKRRYVFGSQHAEVAGGEQDVPDQAEEADLRHLSQVNTSDAGEGQGGHEHLQGITGHRVGAGDRGGVQVGVVDLDADEDQS